MPRGGERDVDEVTDALHGQAEIGEVAVVEARLRIVLLQVRQRRRIDEQRDRQLAVGLAQQKLLARRPCRLEAIARAVVDDKRVDGEPRFDAVERLEPKLQPRKQRTRRSPPGSLHCSRPSPFGGMTPRAASRAAALALFVRCHMR